MKVYVLTGYTSDYDEQNTWVESICMTPEASVAYMKMHYPKANYAVYEPTALEVKFAHEEPIPIYKGFQNARKARDMIEFYLHEYEVLE